MKSDQPIGAHLALATVSFAVCFVAWGLISAFAPYFRERFALSATQTALLIAVPVLLGSLARLPMGLLSDRFGGRAGVRRAHDRWSRSPSRSFPPLASYGSLLAVALFLGLAGSSFAVGVTYVSRWTPPAGQGAALGVYGLGNVGAVGGRVPRSRCWPPPRAARGLPHHPPPCSWPGAPSLRSPPRDAPARTPPGSLVRRPEGPRAGSSWPGRWPPSTSSPSAGSSRSPSTCRPPPRHFGLTAADAGSAPRASSSSPR